MSGIVAVVVGTILFCTIEWPTNRVLLDGELTQVDVTPFRVVNVSVDEQKLLDEGKMAIFGGLSIVQSTDGKPSFSYPKAMEHYFSIVEQNDTLHLIFKSQPNSKTEDEVFLEISKMILTADSSLVAVRSDVSGLSVNLMKLESDSVSLKASFINVDSCRFRSLSVQQAMNLKLRNSLIHDAFLDLDSIRHWSADSCQVETTYLTGSKRHYDNWDKRECSRMYWKPKNKDAELRLYVILNEETGVSLSK